jgi:hypothetical protein
MPCIMGHRRRDNYLSAAESFLASMRTGRSRSASFHSAKKSRKAFLALAVSPASAEPRARPTAPSRCIDLDERFFQAREAFSAPRFKALYRTVIFSPGQRRLRPDPPGRPGLRSPCVVDLDQVRSDVRASFTAAWKGLRAASNHSTFAFYRRC